MVLVIVRVVLLPMVVLVFCGNCVGVNIRYTVKGVVMEAVLMVLAFGRGDIGAPGGVAYC